ncbi:MAG TPA: (Fe-S)-binding protein [Phycisphaerae bacterium]|nr:(Fe-S)-binding protein [Phycisphaerae bacterium]
MSETKDRIQQLVEALPGLDCGICGYRTCQEFAKLVADKPEELKRCTNVSEAKVNASPGPGGPVQHGAGACGPSPSAGVDVFGRSSHADGPLVTAAGCRECDLAEMTELTNWQDSLGRDYDFILDTFPNEPGPRETILPHNPQLTKEMEITKGDIMIGRPLGMSCGCPITHCGVVMDVDPRNGVIVWCVTGPLNPRSKPHKDIGYYSAEAYEGLVKDTRSELKIGMRYWFLPRRCMLQWRHSGLVNFISRTNNGTQVRIEGLLIG